MKMLIAIILILSLNSACTGKDGTLDLRKPYSLDLTPPDGPPQYEQGWTDGCESGMNAYSHDFYKMIKAFKLQMDPKLRSNRMYYQAWKDAFLYCAMFWDSVNGTKL